MAKKPAGVPLNLRIDPALKLEFGHWCLDNGREMTEVIAGLLRQMLDRRIKAPPKKPKHPK